MPLYNEPFEQDYERRSRNYKNLQVGEIVHNGKRWKAIKFYDSASGAYYYSYFYQGADGRFYSSNSFSGRPYFDGQPIATQVEMLPPIRGNDSLWDFSGNPVVNVPPPPPPPNPNNTPPPPPPAPAPRPSTPPPPGPSYPSFDSFGGSQYKDNNLENGLYAPERKNTHPGTGSGTIGLVDTTKVKVRNADDPEILSRSQDNSNKNVYSRDVSVYTGTSIPGDMYNAIFNAFNGFNKFSGPPPIPHSKDISGYTFFVRPQLNLQTVNIRNVRKLYSLMNDTGDKNFNVNKAIRCILDPRYHHGYNPFTGSSADEQLAKSELTPDHAGFIGKNMVDAYSPFISILSNTVKSISGWPDITIQAYTSKAGLYNEMYTQVDSHSNYYEAYDLDVTFKNIVGDPVTYLFYIWITYASLVYEGLLLPYMDYIKENTIDYTSRIYRLVMDGRRNRVSKIMCTGYCFPLGIPTGSFFDFDEANVYSDQNKDITIRFRCSGAMYNDEIIVKWFNEASAIFNPVIRNYIKSNYMVLDKNYSIIGESLAPATNYMGWPIINPHTRVLEWIVPDKDLLNGAAAHHGVRRPIYQFT